MCTYYLVLRLYAEHALNNKLNTYRVMRYNDLNRRIQYRNKQFGLGEKK